MLIIEWSHSRTSGQEPKAETTEEHLLTCLFSTASSPCVFIQTRTVYPSIPGPTMDWVLQSLRRCSIDMLTGQFDRDSLSTEMPSSQTTLVDKNLPVYCCNKIMALKQKICISQSSVAGNPRPAWWHGQVLVTDPFLASKQSFFDGCVGIENPLSLWTNGSNYEHSIRWPNLSLSTS